MSLGAVVIGLFSQHQVYDTSGIAMCLVLLLTVLLVVPHHPTTTTIPPTTARRVDRPSERGHYWNGPGAADWRSSPHCVWHLPAHHTGIIHPHRKVSVTSAQRSTDTVTVCCSL